MKKFLKIIAVLLGLFLLAAGGLTVFIKTKYPPERIKALVVEEAGKRLHRELRLGDASVGLLKGLALSDAQLSERPNFAAGTFLSVKGLSVKPALLPLLKGEVAIKSASLDAPSVRVVRRADGTYNFSDLAGGTDTAKSPGASAEKGGAPKLLISRFSLRNGAVTFVDQSTAAVNLAAREVNASLDGFSFLAPFRADVAAQVDGKIKNKPVTAKTAFRGKISLWQGGALNIETFTASLGKTSVEAKGEITRMENPAFDLALKLSPLDAGSFAPFVTLPAALNGAQASGEVAVKGALTQLNVRGTINARLQGLNVQLDLTAYTQGPLANPAVKARAGFRGLTAENSPLLPGVGLADLDGAVDVTGNAKALAATLQINDDNAALHYGQMAAKGADGRVQLAGKVNAAEPFTDPFFDLQGRVENLRLAAGPPLPAELKPEGPLHIAFTAKGKPSDVRFTVSLDGKGAAVAYGALFAKPAGTPLNLKAAGGLKDQKDLVLDSASGQAGPASFTGKGRVMNMTGKGFMDLSLSAAPFATDGLAALLPMAKEYKLSGKAGADVAIKGSFDAPKIAGTAALKGLAAVPMDGLALTDLNGVVRFTDDSVETEDLQGNLNGSELSTKARVKNFDRMDLWLDGSLAQLDAGALLKTFSSTAAATGAEPGPNASPAPAGGKAAPAPIAKTQGTFRVGTILHPNYLGKKFQLKWDLTNVGPDMGKSNGSAEFSAADGKIYNLPLAQKINKLLKKNDASEITYRSMSAHFKVKDGRLATPDFTVDSSQADILATGSVLLTTMIADMRVVMKLAAGSLGGSAGEWFSGDDGRPTIEATITGPLSDPKVAVDVSKAVKRAGEQYLKKGLEKFLGLPSNKPDQPAPGGGEAPADGTTAPQAAPSEERPKPAQKAVQEGLKTLDKLFKKK